MLGLMLYLVKVLHSPIGFTSYDELLQLHTTNDILQNNQLFLLNPLLPVSPFFPGLGIATSAVMNLTGLGVFTAGVLVIGAARLVFLLGLFLFYKAVSNSTQFAGIASLVYITNQNFIWFDALFSYESLALAFAALILFAAARRLLIHTDELVGLNITIMLSVGAVVITHHITAYILTLFLLLWSMIFYLWAAMTKRRNKPHNRTACQGHSSLYPQDLTSLGSLNGERANENIHLKPVDPNGLALLIFVSSLTWLVFSASIAINYLAGPFIKTVTEFINLIVGEQTARQLFRDYAGQVSPMWEQLISYTSVGLILVSLPLGLLQIWRHYRNNMLAILLAICVLAYPLSLLFRFTQLVANVARTTASLFVAVAFVAAATITIKWMPNPAGIKRILAFTVLVTVVFMGGVIVGWSDWQRLPGPYLVVADNRSIEAQGLASSKWILDSLGKGNRIASDRINALLMGTYGEQHPVTGFEKVLIAPLFFSTEFDSVGLSILRRGQIRFIVIDHRLSLALPKNGVYFDLTEQGAFNHIVPINPLALEKFDRVNELSRIFDSGDIVIYDAGKYISTR